MRGDLSRPGRCLAVALFVLPGLLSCAYFNTFFVAKKSFRAAEASVEKSKDEAIPTDARRGYTNAIRQCKKVLLNHPKSRWVDDAVLLLAASYYGIGEYDSALYSLAGFETRFPESRFRGDAIFLSGRAQTKQRNYDEAAALFERVVREFPNFERKDEILFTQAETAATLRDRAEAVRRYSELVRLYPKSPRSEDALERAGLLHFEESHYDSASIYFGRLLARTRGKEREIDAAILQAQALIRLDRAEEALRLLNEVEPKDVEVQQAAGRQTQTTTDELARIRLEQAAAFNRLGRRAEAIATLSDVSSQQGSERAIEAQFQIGYTYETLMDSLDAARVAYDKAASMSGRSIFKDQAAARSTALKSLAELQEKEGSGDEALEGRADAALRIAEILYLDRKLIDEAMLKYRDVEEQFPDSRAAPRAAYALAYIRWKQLGDSLGAQQEFRDLVGRYPASSQARGVIDLLVRQEADTAGLLALLVASAPETLAVAPDTAHSEGITRTDSVAAPVADSMGGAPFTSGRGRANSVSARVASRVHAAPDSLGEATEPPWMRFVDSMRVAPGNPTQPGDTLLPGNDEGIPSGPPRPDERLPEQEGPEDPGDRPPP